MLTTNENLHMIRPYLNDITYDHKSQGEWRIHSGNTIIKNKSQGEWKIYLPFLLINKIYANQFYFF